MSAEREGGERERRTSTIAPCLLAERERVSCWLAGFHVLGHIVLTVWRDRVNAGFTLR